MRSAGFFLPPPVPPPPSSAASSRPSAHGRTAWRASERASARAHSHNAAHKHTDAQDARGTCWLWTVCLLVPDGDPLPRLPPTSHTPTPTSTARAASGPRARCGMSVRNCVQKRIQYLKKLKRERPSKQTTPLPDSVCAVWDTPPPIPTKKNPKTSPRIRERSPLQTAHCAHGLFFLMFHVWD